MRRRGLLVLGQHRADPVRVAQPVADHPPVAAADHAGRVLAEQLPEPGRAVGAEHRRIIGRDIRQVGLRHRREAGHRRRLDRRFRLQHHRGVDIDEAEPLVQRRAEGRGVEQDHAVGRHRGQRRLDDAAAEAPPLHRRVGADDAEIGHPAVIDHRRPGPQHAVGLQHMDRGIGHARQPGDDGPEPRIAEGRAHQHHQRLRLLRPHPPAGGIIRPPPARRRRRSAPRPARPARTATRPGRSRRTPPPAPR